MIFAITVICGVSGAPCIVAQNNASPFPTQESCIAAHTERRVTMNLVGPLLAAEWGQRVRVHEVCAPLDRIRRVVPDAFPDHMPEADT